MDRMLSVWLVTKGFCFLALFAVMLIVTLSRTREGVVPARA
jgi:hypothetical protein